MRAPLFAVLGRYVRLGYHASSDRVVYVVIDIRYSVAPRDDVPFERGCVAFGRVIDYTVADFEREVHSLAVVLENVNHSQRLLVVREMREFVQRPLARVSVRRMPEVVPERYRFGKILVEPKRARNRTRYLAYFERMREPRPIVIAFGREKHLRFMFKSAKRFTMQNAVAVALVLRSHIAFGNKNLSPARLVRLCRVRRKVLVLYFVNYGFIISHYITY